MLSRLYSRATEIRRAWYGGRPHRARRLARPVVSVGNLAIGGSGKTPIVAALAEMLLAAGERPSILSRGYRRRAAADGVVVVSDGGELRATPAESGDEPYMLARKLAGVPVLVSADRYLAGRLAEQRFGCTVHLLDDGFQHLQLARDVDVVVISRGDLDEPLLPAGRLREPVSAARAADALLVPGRDEDLQTIAARTGVETVFGARPHYREPRVVAPASASREASASARVPAGKRLGAPLTAAIGRRAVAVAGIARPARFFSALRELGYEVVREVAFRDHYWFTARDLDRIHQMAVACAADVVITTEKDAARLEARPIGVGRATPPHRAGAMGTPGSGPPREPDTARVTDARNPVWVFLPMEVSFEPGDGVARWLAARLADARRTSGEAA